MKPIQSTTSSPPPSLSVNPTRLISSIGRPRQVPQAPAAFPFQASRRPTTPEEKRAQVIQIIDEALRILDDDDFYEDFGFISDSSQ